VDLRTRNPEQNQRFTGDGSVNPTVPLVGADISAGGKSYSGGSFIIEAVYAETQSTIARGQAQGVMVNKINTAFIAQVPNTITSFPRTVPDQVNGKLAAAHYNAAGMRFAGTAVQDPTQAAYVFGNPKSLNQCNDVYVLHADPLQWPASSQTALTNFVASGGWLYHVCRLISELDVDVTHFRSTDSLQSTFQRHAAVRRQFNDVTAVLCTPLLET
jgi:hypothetical protein